MSVTLDRFMGDSLLHFSYSTAAGSMGVPPLDSQLGGSFVTAFSQGQGLNASLNAPFLHQNISSPSGETSHLFPTAARNPNKAIVTIDAHSSLILVANEMTCELFGYQRNDLVGMKVQNLFAEPYWAKQRALVEQNIDASGETVLVSGKVVGGCVEVTSVVLGLGVMVDSDHDSYPFVTVDGCNDIVWSPVPCICVDEASQLRSATQGDCGD